MGYRAEKEKIEKKIRLIRFIALCVALAFVLGLCIFSAIRPPITWKYYVDKPDVDKREEGELRIHFLDVGQGDSTLIELPDGKVVLIDGGDESTQTTNTVLRYLNALKIKTIDYLFVTHEDTDHCGSLAMLVQCKKVLNAYLPVTNIEKASDAYVRFYEAILEEKGCEIHYASRSTVLRDEAGTYTLSCLYPYTLDVDENVAEWAQPVSSVMWLDYMGVNALFMGDAGTEIENMLMSDMRNGLLPSVNLTSTEILKVGHHGSKGSTSEAFLDCINPQAAVISCGENNYGHPSETVLSNLKTQGVEIFRTDEKGTVMMSVSSGEGFSVGFIE